MIDLRDAAEEARRNAGIELLQLPPKTPFSPIRLSLNSAFPVTTDSPLAPVTTDSPLTPSHTDPPSAGPSSHVAASSTTASPSTITAEDAASISPSVALSWLQEEMRRTGGIFGL